MNLGIFRTYRFHCLALFLSILLTALFLSQTGTVGPAVQVQAQVPAPPAGCYATMQQAVAAVPAASISPTACFVWDDCMDQAGNRWWRPIPGTGCAHWVAHQLGFTDGLGQWGPNNRRANTCYQGFYIRVGDVVNAYGGTRIALRCCEAGDLWENGGRRQLQRSNQYGERQPVWSKFWMPCNTAFSWWAVLDK
jgi:hypothetical protein